MPIANWLLYIIVDIM